MSSAVLDRNKLKRLYSRGYSAIQIAKKTGISVWSIYKLMKRSGIERRSPSEANHVWFAGKPASFRPKKVLTGNEEFLRITGLTLYWAEGTKRGKLHTLDFANSDPIAIAVFLKFLRKIYRVSEKRLRVMLYCYSNQPIPKLLRYWSKVTKVPLTQFTKPYVRNDYKIEKRGRMPYGLVHIRYSDKKLMLRLLSDVRSFQQDLLGYGSRQTDVAVISSVPR